MSGKVMSVILGGLLIGLISAIPIVGWGFVIWAFIGGLLATFWFVRKSPIQVTQGEGLVLGLLAGILGAIVNIIGVIVIQIIVGIIFAIISAAGNGDIAAAIMGAIFSVLFSGTFTFIINAVLSIPIVLFALLGGWLGVLFFEKRATTQAPPQPYGYPQY